MLLTIVCVFIITEIPQGIMNVLSGMFSEEFRYNIYNNVGDMYAYTIFLTKYKINSILFFDENFYKSPFDITL